MVNNRDYNEFMLQDNTILKLRAINRTFAGDSKYIYWHDPRENYENVKIFGDDGVMYFNTREGDEETCETISYADLPAEDPPNHEDLVDALVDNYIEPLLSTTAFFTRFVLEGVAPAAIRTEFSTAERTSLETELVSAIDTPPLTVYGHYDSGTDTWTFDNVATDYWFSIENTGIEWQLCYTTYRLVFHSDETKFWNTNQGDSVITTDTLNTNLDNIIVLKANTGMPDTTPTLLTQNYGFDVLGQRVITEGTESGLPSIHDLWVLPEDENGDGFPDNPDLSYLIGASDYVYFNRATTTSPWIFQTKDQDTDVAAEYAQDQIDNPDPADQLWKRESGVEGVNFAWFHRTPRYHLTDPAASNIIDTYIITRGYARNIRLWLNGQLDSKPEAPTPFQLRSDYQDLLENKMISDTVILHTGAIKVILGPKADPELQGTIKVIRSADRSLSNTQIKTTIVNVVREFFDITKWEFGETFYFSELAATIHAELPAALDSVVLVPTLNTNQFGDLYQVFTKEDEIIQVDFSVNQVEIVESLDASTLQQ